MKNTIGRIGYGFIGVVLLCSFMLTGSFGLSMSDRECYKYALEQQLFVDTLGFASFRLIDYPVVVYTGDRDYVIQGDKISSRKPVIDTLVGTAWPVNGHYEVFIPSYHDMVNIYAATGLLAGHAVMLEYDQSNHVATIWHEAYHAWQITRYGDCMKYEGGIGDITRIDEYTAYRETFKKEQLLLSRAIAQDDDLANTLAVLMEQIYIYDTLLTEQERTVIAFYELCEGCAFYVESQVYRQMKGDSAYRDFYLALPSDYTNGTWKYYQSGMLKCMILDKLDPDWKERFTFDSSINTLLLNTILLTTKGIG